MQVTRRDAELTQLFRVLDQFKALGYCDLSFTGGEPLLKPALIGQCLDYMRQIDYQPDLKFVSNGRALRQDLLERLRRYPGRLRFNISMHSLNPVHYHRIVKRIPDWQPGDPDDLAKVQTNLTRLREADIPFKLNFVLLKGLNTDLPALDQIFSYSLRAGATRVKFLELLITKELKHLYPYYFRLDALKDLLGEQLSFVKDRPRRRVYRYRDTPLLVELQHCTCSLGCNRCALNRDFNLTAELHHFPCFLKPETGTDLTTTDIASAVTAGARQIVAMARHYREHSPLIVRGRYLAREESAYFYAIACDDIPLLLEHLGDGEPLELIRHRQVTEHFFSDGSDAFDRFEFVRKLAINSYDHLPTEITQQHLVDPVGSGRIETYFGEDNPSVSSVEAYQRELAQKGFHPILQTDWVIDYYGRPGLPTQDAVLSIGHFDSSITALVRSNSALQDVPIPLDPLKAPVAAWVRQILQDTNRRSSPVAAR